MALYTCETGRFPLGALLHNDRQIPRSGICRSSPPQAEFFFSIRHSPLQKSLPPLYYSRYSRPPLFAIRRSVSPFVQVFVQRVKAVFARTVEYWWVGTPPPPPHTPRSDSSSPPPSPASSSSQNSNLACLVRRPEAALAAAPPPPLLL